jgi:nitroimidazol reductase NimA-like FMN-containing flavoprotein (pyridoxamine 5'-phosphate oxidase superfamily)
MRRKDKEISDKNIIDEIIRNSNICRIAMIDNGLPYLLPLNYGYFDGNLYFHSALSGRKIDILKQNNYVCFEIEGHTEIITGEKACDWTTKYRSVVGYGHIEFETDIEDKRKGLDIIMKAHGKLDENIYSESSLKPMLILKLKIESVSGKQSGDW